MNFKLWLETADIRFTSIWKNPNGTKTVIVQYPSGDRYAYTSEYSIILDKIYRQAKFNPGIQANKLKELVSKGYATVEKQN